VTPSPKTRNNERTGAIVVVVLARRMKEDDKVKVIKMKAKEQA
jgi:hypothetical protein